MQILILRKIQSPTFFFILFLSSFSVFFLDSPSWWPIQLGIQLTICCLGLLNRYWRPLAIFFIFLILFVNIFWFSLQPKLPDNCHEQVDYVSGISKISSIEPKLTLNLSKVKIWCKGEQVNWPTAIVHFDSNKLSRKGWYRVGDRIELRNVKILGHDFFKINLKPLRYFKIFNISYQEKVLNRGRLLLYIQSKARYYLDDFSLSIFKGLLTADRSGFSVKTRQRIRDLGISHLFAISGMHIGLLYLWIFFALRMMLLFSNRWVEKGFAILVLDFFCLVLIFFFLRAIGMPISAKRSLIMLSWWVITRHFFPWQPLWFILLGTAALILVFSPSAVAKLSFQLSFLSVVGILLILPVIPKPKLKDSIFRIIFRVMVSTIIISAWLFLYTYPIIDQLPSYHSITSVLNNLIHILYLSLVFMPLVLLTMVYTLFGYTFMGMPGEYYLYSFVNFFGNIWEQLFSFCEFWNYNLMWRHSWKWDFPLMVGYWVALSFFALIVVRLKAKMPYYRKSIKPMK